jgi:hypothetical protein
VVASYRSARRRRGRNLREDCCGGLRRRSTGAIAGSGAGGATPELEFETNLTWLPAERTRGWVSSHFDIVDKLSAAERPADRRAYTHKLNFELDTSFGVFNWLPEGRWLRGVELEGSFDHVATGLPKAGDVVDGVRFVDHSSPWSFSLVFVVPIAPL